MTKRHKRNLNYAGLLALLLLLIIGFVSPIYYSNIMGEKISTSTDTWFNVILDIFGSESLTYTNFNNVFYLMFLSFCIILILYFLSGVSLLKYKWAKYASILTFVYFFLGVLSIAIFNRENAQKLFGFDHSN